MQTSFWNSVTPAQRRYLLVDSGLSPFIINFLINYGVAWLVVRHLNHMPLWGQPSIAVDTIATSFLLPLITCLIVTPIGRGQVRAGKMEQLRNAGWKWIPRSIWLRSVLIGTVCMLVLAPLTVLVFKLLGIAALTPRHFIYFKATFAALEGGLVTPFMALWAISDDVVGEAPVVGKILESAPQ